MSNNWSKLSSRDLIRFHVLNEFPRTFSAHLVRRKKLENILLHLHFRSQANSMNQSFTFYEDVSEQEIIEFQHLTKVFSTAFNFVLL